MFQLRIFKSILVLVMLVVGSYAWSAGTPTITGNMPRSNDPAYFDFKFSVSSLSDAAAGNGSSDDMFKDRVQVFITSSSASDPIDLGTCASSPFVAEQTNGKPEQSGSSGSYTLTYSLRVKPCSSAKSIANVFVSTGSRSVKIKVGFRDSKTGTFATSEEKTLTALTSVPKDAPTLSQLKVDDSTIVATFSASATPKYVDGNTYSTSGVSAIAIDIDEIQADTGRFKLPTRVLNSNATEDDVATDGQKCTYVMNTSTCVVCSTANSYVDVAAISASYLKVKAASTSDTKVTFSGLKNGRSYAIFMVYDNGVTPTACLTGSPAKTYAFSEGEGENETKNSDPKCFIATAAYGSPWHPNVELFRWFRDHVLLKFSVGKRMVDFYYEKSPPLANYIEERPLVSSVVAAALWIPAVVVAALKSLSANPKLLAGVALLMIALVSAVSKRRRGRVLS